MTDFAPTPVRRRAFRWWRPGLLALLLIGAGIAGLVWHPFYEAARQAEIVGVELEWAVMRSHIEAVMGEISVLDAMRDHFGPFSEKKTVAVPIELAVAEQWLPPVDKFAADELVFEFTHNPDASDRIHATENGVRVRVPAETYALELVAHVDRGGFRATFDVFREVLVREDRQITTPGGSSGSSISGGFWAPGTIGMLLLFPGVLLGLITLLVRTLTAPPPPRPFALPVDTPDAPTLPEA